MKTTRVAVMRALANAVCVIASACHGGAPEVRDYLIAERAGPGATTNAAAVVAPARDLPAIRVKPLAARSFLEHQEIAWREGDVLAGTYRYHRWSEPPAEMVTRALQEALRDGGRFEAVDGPAPRAVAPFTIGGELLALNEVAESDGSRPRGVVELELTLETDARDGAAARHWTLRSRKVVDAGDDSIDALVRALSEATTAAVDEVARAVETTIAGARR